MFINKFVLEVDPNMDNENLFWTATLEDLCNGYIYDHEQYICLICRAAFEDGVIYPINQTMYEARKAIQAHIQEAHSSMFDYLLHMDKKYTGLSDHQKELLQYFYEGLTDKEIVKKIGAGSTSTIRQHRFKFKEKEKQAKIFLALMQLLNNNKKNNHEELVPIHKGATMVDDRYAITFEEREKVLKTYFKQGLDGPLDSFPSKEKRKIIVLQQIMNRFDRTKKYTEKEVNEILKKIHADYVTIRRYLIEYGFMDRNKDCTEYWVKQ